MTAHVHLVKREADEGEATEDAPVGLPGETPSPLAGLPGEEAPPLVVSPEDRAAGDDKRAALSGARFEALLRTLLPHRSARPRDAGERRADEAEPVGVAGTNEGAAPQLTKGLAKPLWQRPVAIGGAAAVLAASLPAIILFSSSSPPRPVVAEPGMEAQPHRELMAPAAALATVPKREAAAESPAKPVPPGERSDQLREILALHVEPKKAAPGDAKNGAGALEPAKPTQDAPRKIAAPVVSGATEVGKAEAGKAEAVAPRKEAGEPGLNPEAAVKIAAAVAIDPSIEARREAAEAAARRAAVKEQTQVLEKVTQLGALVTHLSEQVNELQAKVKTLSDGSEEKFADLGRRIALGEAGRSLNAATAAQTAPPPSGAATLALPRDAEPGAPPPAKIVRATVKAPPAAAEAETPRRYRIQAASPGLAMLAAIGGGVEDDAPLQVAVGAKIPGYGRITRIEQRGAAWVVETDRGSIQ